MTPAAVPIGVDGFINSTNGNTLMPATKKPSGYTNRYAGTCIECGGIVEVIEGTVTSAAGGWVLVHEHCPEFPTPVPGEEEYRFSKRSGQWHITGPDLRVGRVALVSKRTGPSEWYLLDAVNEYGATGTALTVLPGESIATADLRSFKLLPFSIGDSAADERVLGVVLGNVGVASDGTFWVPVAKQTFKRLLGPEIVVARRATTLEEVPAADRLAKKRALDEAIALVRTSKRKGERGGPEAELSEVVILDGDAQHGRYAGFSSDGARIIFWALSTKGIAWNLPRTSVARSAELAAAVRLVATSDEPWFW